MGRSRSAISGGGHDRGGAGVVQGVSQLSNRVRDGQRHSHPAGPPDAPLHGHVSEPGSNQEGDPGFAEVIAAVQQPDRDRCGGVDQVSVAKRPLGAGHGDVVHMGSGAGHQGKSRCFDCHGRDTLCQAVLSTPASW